MKKIFLIAMLMSTSAFGQEMGKACSPSESLFSFSSNGVQYACQKSKDGYQWQVDHAAMKESRKREEDKSNLYWAMRTRILTKAEMKRALAYGDYLNVSEGVSYNEEEKKHELNDAYYQQARLKALGK